MVFRKGKGFRSFISCQLLFYKSWISSPKFWIENLSIENRCTTNQSRTAFFKKRKKKKEAAVCFSALQFWPHSVSRQCLWMSSQQCWEWGDVVELHSGWLTFPLPCLPAVPRPAAGQLRISDVTHSTMRLNWDAAPGPVRKYIITYKPEEGEVKEVQLWLYDGVLAPLQGYMTNTWKTSEGVLMQQLFNYGRSYDQYISWSWFITLSRFESAK